VSAKGPSADTTVDAINNYFGAAGVRKQIMDGKRITPTPKAQTLWVIVRFFVRSATKTHGVMVAKISQFELTLKDEFRAHPFCSFFLK